MSSTVPSKPALLTEFLRLLAEGDEMNKARIAMTPSLRAELDAIRTVLDGTISKSQMAKAASRDATKSNREAVKKARVIARRVRDAVFSMYTKDDPRIGDYGLSTPVKHRSKKDAQSEPKSE